jgi:DNA-binding LytR/AlgR family response regulator
MIRCIIIADNANSALLKEFVGKYSSLSLSGSFIDSESARIFLSGQHDTDLAFIDLDTLKIDCFDFLSSIKAAPNVILVSSGDQDALKAFEFNIVDYLLKPVSYSRFCRAVDKASNYYSRQGSGNADDNEIFIKKGSSLVKLKLKDIIYVEALENYVILNTGEERFTIHFTMKGIEYQLPKKIFCRIHRSFIVNKSMIHRIQEDSLDLAVGKSLKNLPVGKSFRGQLIDDINLISK